MKLRLYILSLLLISSAYGGPINGKTLTAAGRIVRGSAKWVVATFAAVGGAAALNAHLSKGEAAYALRLDLNSNARSIYWADLFSKPDIFPVIQVEGLGEFLIPEMVQNYSGASVIWTFKIPQIPRGREVSVLILDDDSLSDQIWRNILSTRWSVNVDGKITFLQGMSVSFSTADKIQLTDGSLTIDGPDQLCHYLLKVPYLYVGGDWNTEGILKDQNNKDVGHIRFSQVTNR